MPQAGSSNRERRPGRVRRALAYAVAGAVTPRLRQ